MVPSLIRIADFSAKPHLVIGDQIEATEGRKGLMLMAAGVDETASSWLEILGTPQIDCSPENLQFQTASDTC